MTRHEQLVEQYEDAYFALLMEEVAQAEGSRLERLNLDLQDNPTIVPNTSCDQRCLKTINRYYSRIRWSQAYRVTKKTIHVIAIFIAVITTFFTTAFAVSETVRINTLNLILTVNEEFYQFDMQKSEPPSVSIEKGAEGAGLYFKDLRIEWIPDGYTYSSGEYNYQAVFYNLDGSWIILNRYDGTAQINIDTENAEVVEPLEINGSTGILVIKDGQTHIALSNTNKNVFITLLASKAVPRDVVERFAKNIFIN